MKKSIVRITCFLLILGSILGYVNKIFKVKYGDGIYGVTKFYELEKNTVDVLFLGSSHAFENFNTGTLWDEYGMASYILAGSVQPMWNTYHYLKEALKTQRPELIVLEGYMTRYEEEFADDSRIIKNNYGLHWSKNKIESLKISIPKDRWEEFFLEYTQYHTRYRELNVTDFLRNQNNKMYDDWKGFGCNMATMPMESIDVSGIENRLELNEKTEKYYRLTIELAQEFDIPIVVIISPYPDIDDCDQQKFNTAGDIAAEYGVPFLNCNLELDEIGIDYSTDAADASHLNYKGNQIYSKFIGNYLKENFVISDRRNDSSYASWQRSAEYTAQMINNQEFLESRDISQILVKIENPNYWVFITIDGDCHTGDSNLQYLFYDLGIYEKETGGMWYKTKDEIMFVSEGSEEEKYIHTDKYDFCMRSIKYDDGKYKNSLIINKKQYLQVSNGVNIVVYDTVTEKIVDAIGIDMDDNYTLVR